jgi:hypothetical protein
MTPLESFTSSLDWFDSAIDWSGICVAGGLIVEYAPDFSKRIKDCKWLDKACLIIGALLIVGGVSGETYFHHQYSKVARKQELAARHEADEQRRQIALLENDTAKANDRAAQAELRTAQLEAKIAWRNLGPADQASIGSKLAQYAGERADLGWHPDSVEAGKFASDIQAALELAHWQVFNRADPAGVNGMPSVSGVLILTMPNDRSEMIGHACFDALQSSHVIVSIQPLTRYFPSWLGMGDRKLLDSYSTRLLIEVGNHP